jgi:hypothetical protein
LGLEPWNLIETTHMRRRLNDRGIAFMQGKLRVPRDIVFDTVNNVFVEKQGTEMIGINFFAK